jgi:U3 small nucleolar ribonucleoprotein protein LCP5
MDLNVAHQTQLLLITAEISKLRDRIKTVQIKPMAEGISLLNVRLHSLLAYLINLTFLILCKTNGQPLPQKCVEKLVELRQVLERTKPLETKLHYQITKLSQLATIDTLPNSVPNDHDTALMFKPDLENFVVEKIIDDDDEKEFYKPPRVVPVPYLDKPKKRITQQVKEKAIQSRLLRDISTEFSTAPEEIKANETRLNSKDDVEWNDRIAFEEENFVRMNVTRKDKALMKRMQRTTLTNELNEMHDDFGDLAGLHSLVENDPMDENKQRDDAQDVIGRASRGRKSQGKDAFAKDKKKFKKMRTE